MTALSLTQQKTFMNIMEQLLPSHSVSSWTDETPLLGEIAEFDSMMLTNLLAAIEEVFDVQVDESQLSLVDFSTWGQLKSFVGRLVQTQEC